MCYGTGNLSSVQKSLSEVSVSSTVISTRADLLSVDALVLPGVGHFGSAMRYLAESGLLADLRLLLRDGLPTLGICLGFQLLCEYSEEDLSTTGLGLFPLGVTKLSLKRGTTFKVPQIGWNTVRPVAGGSLLFDGLSGSELLFYFSNSFGVKSTLISSVSTSYFHGEHYLALVESTSIFGVQFHPEKSGEQGLHVLRNFARLVR